MHVRELEIPCGILPTKSFKIALGTSYGRPVGGTELGAFVDEGAETVGPKHLEKVREDWKEEEETNEMLFHHKPRPAAEGPARASPNVLTEYFFGDVGQRSRLHTSLNCLCVWGSFASNSMPMDVPQALEVPKPSLCQSVDEI